MATVIEMPKLSDTMTVGTLVNWLKNEGDEVTIGDALAEVETDKATMELECFEEGVLLKQLASAGDEVAVGTAIAAVGEKGEKFDASSVKSSGQSEDTKPKDEEKEDDKKEESEKKSDKAKPEASSAKKEPTAKKSESSATSSSASKEEESSGNSRRKISPLARKLAEEKGVSLDGVKGTGPGGRVVKADVLAAAERGDSAPATGTSSSAGSAQSFPVIEGGAIAEEEKIKVSSMRGTIARRLLESKTQIPHFYLEIEVNAAPLLKLRADLNASLTQLPPEKGGAKLSVNDFIMKASAEALRRVPLANCSWGGDHIQQHPDAHVSFAVAIDDGLITPVIQKAQNKSLRQISAEVKSLARKARDKKLKPDEFTGGTFCVSNLGMFGISRFNAIINPPNAAILAVGATRKVPVVNEKNEIVPGERISLTLSCDHRVVDGAVGAQFLQALQELIENPALMLV
ncbi:MAG: pyruvate dehydrogenase complex dihydrolipoamide acetyltransferase [Opitutales bacterium]|nr:pyruvate dehydrogenase complex dihydrolipoamide acetyltransferase [Opitutales bacterium]MCH8540898.1 pyruvate dehydrogenase complex dihydrolipoamide acetyltransferase [Opitutales bacterium]